MSRPPIERLLVLDRDALPRIDTPGVQAEPAWQWLLASLPVSANAELP